MFFLSPIRILGQKNPPIEQARQKSVIPATAAYVYSVASRTTASTSCVGLWIAMVSDLVVFTWLKETECVLERYNTSKARPTVIFRICCVMSPEPLICQLHAGSGRAAASSSPLSLVRTGMQGNSKARMYARGRIQRAP
jgi:hypothetical protein